MDQVITADAEGIAITSDHPYRQIGAAHRKAGGNSWGAAVNGVETVGVHVEREARGAANTRNKDDVLFAKTQLGHEPLNGGEDGVVTAPRAPAHLLIGLEILGRELNIRLGHQGECRECVGAHLVSSRLAATSVMTSTSSADLNGKPRT